MLLGSLIGIYQRLEPHQRYLHIGRQYKTCHSRFANVAELSDGFDTLKTSSAYYLGYGLLPDYVMTRKYIRKIELNNAIRPL